MSVRTPPRPPHEATPGACSMCGGPLPGRRRSWCSDDCVGLWWIATRGEDARRHLEELHGHACWTCGADWEVRERERWECWPVVYPGNGSVGDRCPLDMPTHGPRSPRPVMLYVDHVRPLWSLTDAERRELRWWLPFNLQLLCERCHQAKTSHEAAHRAAQRRAGVIEAPPPPPAVESLPGLGR